MCGITGFFSNKKLSSAVILRMNAAIRHRGPDDEGYIFDGKHYSGPESSENIKIKYDLLGSDLQSQFSMGFRRLSIIDITDAGHQPMFSEQQNAITYNGEIYNFRELRSELENAGRKFHSNSDTEVILAGYEVWGKEVVEKLDGMFSFCIWDSAKEILFFARDRIGLKPLFYFQNDQGFFWASEIKALLASGKIEPKINWDGVKSNFMYLTAITPDTCFENIKSLKQGYVAEFDLKTKKLVKKRYYKLPAASPAFKSEEKIVEDLELLLKNSISQQLYADVKICSMMSGGIDSTLATVIAKEQDAEIAAFTVQYQHAEREVSNANLVAEQNNINHSTVEITSEEILENLKRDIAHFEEPYVTPEVLMHASKYAKRNGFTVVLSGNGADELFGGYPHLQGFKKWRLIRKFSFISNFLPTSHSIFRKLKNYLSLENAADFFRNGQGGMKPYEVDELFNIQVNSTHRKSGCSYEDYFRGDMHVSLGSHHAFRDDLSAMKYGIEFRYPYLSNRLIDYVASLPENLRFNGTENKPLLRTIASKYLPMEVLNMKKKGFVYPLQSWYEEDQNLRNFISDHLALLKKRGIFNNELIEKWQTAILKPGNLGKIWQLTTFEIWMQTYIDK